MKSPLVFRSTLEREIERSETLLAAIEYAIDVADDGRDWLADWSYGDPDCQDELEEWRKNGGPNHGPQH